MPPLLLGLELLLASLQRRRALHLPEQVGLERFVRLEEGFELPLVYLAVKARELKRWQARMAAAHPLVGGSTSPRGDLGKIWTARALLLSAESNPEPGGPV